MDKKKISNAEKMKRWREQKANKKKAADKKYYEKNRKEKITKVRDSREEKTRRPYTRQNLKAISKKRKQKEKSAEEERREKVREQTRERVKRFREIQRAEFREEEDNSTDNRGDACSATPSSSAFKSRMSKARALKRTTKSLPKTPEKKAELAATVSSSPRTRNILTKKGLIKTPEEKETVALRALAADISEGVQHLKKSGSKDNRATYTAFKTVAFGNNVSKSRAKKSLSKLVGVGRQSVIKAVKDRRKIMSGERKSWLYLERKTRNDAVKDEDKQLIFNYWTYEASRPTGDKKDVIRKRTGKLQYITHVKHVLEKTTN